MKAMGPPDPLPLNADLRLIRTYHEAHNSITPQQKATAIAASLERGGFYQRLYSLLPQVIRWLLAFDEDSEVPDSNENDDASKSDEVETASIKHYLSD